MFRRWICQSEINKSGVLDKFPEKSTRITACMVRRAMEKFCNLAVKNNILYHIHCHFSTYSPATSTHFSTFLLSCSCSENRIFCFDSQNIPRQRSLVIIICKPGSTKVVLQISLGPIPDCRMVQLNKFTVAERLLSKNDLCIVMKKSHS